MIGYGTLWSHNFTVQSAEHDTNTRGWNGFHLPKDSENGNEGGGVAVIRRRESRGLLSAGAGNQLGRSLLSCSLRGVLVKAGGNVQMFSSETPGGGDRTMCSVLRKQHFIRLCTPTRPTMHDNFLLKCSCFVTRVHTDDHAPFLSFCALPHLSV